MRDTPPRPARPILLRLVWTAAALALALGLVRTFLLGVYRVDSASMEPYLHGSPQEGESVLVAYRRRPSLERFDPVVILRPGERDPIVKRAVALPGETVQISGGDLLVDGRRLRVQAPGLGPIAVYDERFESLDRAFQLVGAWRKQGDGWRMEGRSAEPALDVSAAFERKLLDERLGAGGERHGGHVEVGDAILAFDLWLEGPGGRFGLRLSEEGDRFELALDPLEGDLLRLTLSRRSGRGTAEPLSSIELPVEWDRWHHLCFANRDNQLELQLDGDRPCLSHAYEANTPLGGLPDPTYRHLMPRVAFWAAGLDARVRSVRILRDVAYSNRGGYGVNQPLVLGPDELFVLGDNSSESLDSRELGPVSLEEVLGVPLAVVWPPTGWRRLGRPGAGG